MTKRQREDLWKCLFVFSNIAVFVVCGVHLGCQIREKRIGIPILMKTRFYVFRSVLRVILIVKIDEKSSDKSMDFGWIPGETII